MATKHELNRQRLAVEGIEAVRDREQEHGYATDLTLVMVDGRFVAELRWRDNSRAILRAGADITEALHNLSGALGSRNI